MKVLLISADTDQAAEWGELLGAALGSVEITVAATEEAFARRLDEVPPSAVVAMEDPGWLGLNAVADRLRQSWPLVPLMTVDGGAENAQAEAERLAAALAPLSGCDPGACTEPPDQQRYRQLFEAVPVALYLSTEDGRLVDANPAFVRLLGYPSLERLLATDLGDLYAAPEAREQWMEQVKGEGTVMGLESRLLAFDGSHVWVRESTRSLPGEEDGGTRFLGTLEDITAQKRAETELSESQRAHSTLLSNLPGMAYRRRDDERWTVILASEGCRELTGLEPDQLGAGLALADLIHGDDLDGASREVSEAVAADRAYMVQYRLRSVSGRTRWVEEHGRGVENPEGRWIEAFVSDISHRRAAEQAVRDSEVWYRTLFEAANDAVFLMDGARVVDCNSRALAVFGVAIQEVVGAGMADLSTPVQAGGQPSRELLREILQETLRGEDRPLRWRFERSGGEPFDAVLALSRIDVGGRTFVQAIVREVSDSQRAEEALARREKVLEAVGYAAARFLKSPRWEDEAGDVLARLGVAATAKAVSLVEIEPTDPERGLVVQRWRPDVGVDRPGCPRFLSRRWFELLSMGQTIHGAVECLPEDEREGFEAGVHTVVAVPVVAGGEGWGFLEVHDRGHEGWSEGELEAFRAAAEILGASVYLSRANEAVRLRSEQLELLNRVNGLLLSTLDATSVMQTIADLVRQRCAIDHVSFAVVGEGRQEIRFVAWSGYEAVERDTGLAIDGPGVVARVVRTGRPLYAPDVAACADYLCGDERVRVEYAVPLVVDAEVVGALNCEAFTAQAIGAWQREVVDRLATQAALALRNERIVQSLR